MKTRNNYEALRTPENIDSLREYKKTFNAAVETLEAIQTADRFDKKTPADTVAAFVAAVGYPLAVEVVASLVNRSSRWDGRLYSSKDWAAAQPSAWDEETMVQCMRSYTNMHPAHLDQVARALSKFTPAEVAEEPTTEPTAEATETAVEAPEAVPAVAYSINPNPARGSLEITFTAKPDEKTRDALKALGFRWHRARALWYGYASREAVENALSRCEADQAQPIREQSRKPAEKPAEIDLSGLDNLGAKPYGAELAEAIREQLKRRGATGCTVRASKSTHTDHITVTVKATPEDFRSVAEMVSRFGWLPLFRASSVGVYVGGEWRWNIPDSSHPEWLREYYSNCIKDARVREYRHDITEESAPEFTASFVQKLNAVAKIANAWNWDRSDIMTDYFDIGYFCDIRIKCDEFEPREEMTPAEAAQVAADQAKKEAEERERLEAYERERAEAEARRQAYEATERADLETIERGSVVEDVEPFTVCGLVEGIGKEPTLAELRERVAESPRKAQRAQVVRRVTMTPEAFEAFGRRLLCDFDFLANMGGSATDDPRITSAKDYAAMTPEERDSVEWYSVNCVAVYVGDALRLVIDPQGFGYARYTKLPGAEFRTSEQPSREPEAFEASAPLAEAEPVQPNGATLANVAAEVADLVRELNPYDTEPNAAEAVRADLLANPGAVSSAAMASDIIALCRDMDPYDFEDGMIDDVLSDVQNNPENILGWIDSEILEYRDEMPADTVELAERVRLQVAAFFGVSA